MMRRLFVIAMLVLLAFMIPSAPTLGVADEQPITEEPKKAVDVVIHRFHPASRHVLIVGDSEACAVGQYVKQVVKEINQRNGQPLDDVTVSCKVSTTVEYWNRHLQQVLDTQSQAPDYVLVFLGTNHYWQTTVPPVQPIIDMINVGFTNCIWIGNTAVRGKHWKIDGLIRDAVSPACNYFDTESFGIELADGVHPTKTGALKWIELIWGYMLPLKYEED